MYHRISGCESATDFFHLSALTISNTTWHCQSGASRSALGQNALITGNNHTLIHIIFGRLTPLTGLMITELASHRYSNNNERVRSTTLRRIAAPDKELRVRSQHQPSKWARVTHRNCSGCAMLANAMSSVKSFWYARRVCGLSILANQVITGGMSTSWPGQDQINFSFGRIVSKKQYKVQIRKYL
jgi:hypothetical protein